MEVYDLINKFDFHDSLIQDVIYSNQKEEVVLKIELCNWKQTNYKSNEPEMLECSITFNGITQYILEPYYSNFNSDEILDVHYIDEANSRNNFVEFVLMGDDDVKILKLYGENIQCSIK